MKVAIKPSNVAGAGHGLFATADFSPGEIVLAVDRPLIAELDKTRLHDTCAWCFRRGERDSTRRAHNASIGLPSGFIETRACTGCRRVRYCSTACQTRAWKRGEHKFECPILARSPPDMDLPNGVRAVIKLLGRLRAKPDDDRVRAVMTFQPGADAAAMELFKKDNPKRSDEFQTLAYGAYKFSGEPRFEKYNGRSLAHQLFFNVMSNVLTLDDPLDDTQLGIGFDPLVCSANHSCDPNACAVFRQPTVLFRALKPIRAGEEIFIKYIDITNPYSLRQAELHASYFFDCRCNKCRRGAVEAEDRLLKAPSELEPKFIEIADQFISRHAAILQQYCLPIEDVTTQRRIAALQAEVFTVAGRGVNLPPPPQSSVSDDQVRDALRLCLDSGLWGWTRQPVPALLRQLAVSHLAAGQMYRAWRVAAKMYCLCTVPMYPQRFYPDRVVDGWMLTTLTNTLCDPTNAETRDVARELARARLDMRFVLLGLVREVRDQMPHSYGIDSPFGETVSAVYDQMMANVDLDSSQLNERLQETWLRFEAMARNVDIFAT